jgi:hypothetical protein
VCFYYFPYFEFSVKTLYEFFFSPCMIYAPLITFLLIWLFFLLGQNTLLSIGSTVLKRHQTISFPSCILHLCKISLILFRLLYNNVLWALCVLYTDWLSLHRTLWLAWIVWTTWRKNRPHEHSWKIDIGEGWNKCKEALEEARNVNGFCFTECTKTVTVVLEGYSGM